MVPSSSGCFWEILLQVREVLNPSTAADLESSFRICLNPMSTFSVHLGSYTSQLPWLTSQYHGFQDDVELPSAPESIAKDQGWSNSTTSAGILSDGWNWSRIGPNTYLCVPWLNDGSSNIKKQKNKKNNTLVILGFRNVRWYSVWLNRLLHCAQSLWISCLLL